MPLRADSFGNEVTQKSGVHVVRGKLHTTLLLAESFKLFAFSFFDITVYEFFIWAHSKEVGSLDSRSRWEGIIDIY